MIQAPPAHSLLSGGTSWPIWFVGVATLLLIASLLSIWLGSRHHSARAKTVWTTIVVVLPVVGPLAWFLLGREARKGSA